MSHFYPVLRARRSPDNIRKWLCDLSCGHEQWIMAAAPPRKTHCEQCRLAHKAAERAMAQKEPSTP